MDTKAAVLYELGQPDPYQESKPMSVELLSLDGPDAGEILVEVVGAGLCHSDLSVMNGSRPRVMPMVMGHEASGIVREVGKGVTDFAIDDHVVFTFVPICGSCKPCLSGRPALCEKGAVANVDGCLLSGHRPFKNQNGNELHQHLGVSAFSQFTVTAQESAVKITKDIPLEKAALFGCAVMTGSGAVMNTAKVSPGESVVVFGMGGVGLSAIMAAKASGAFPIIGVDMLESKFDIATQAGAHHMVKAGSDKTLDEIRELTQGGADFAIEAVGSEKVLMQAYAATGRGGTTISIGLPHPSKEFVISATTIVAEERTIKGCYMGSSIPALDIPKFIGMYQTGILPVDLLLSREIRLDEINSAFDDLHSGKEIRQIIRFDSN